MASQPLAYLITFSTYGTWLHGDQRWSVDKQHNAFDSPRLPPNPALEAFRRRQMKHPPVYLDAARRAAVRRAIIECCEKRGWELHALSVRTNHIHAVVAAPETSAESVLNALKANATRFMRTEGCWPEPRTPWTDGGSKPYLWKERDLANAVEYVLNGQGAPLD